MQAAGKRWILYPSRSNTITVWAVGDLHMMNRACAEERLQTDIDAIKADPCAFWVGLGDYADFIGYRDKRFDPDSVAEWVSVDKLGQMGKLGYERIRKLFQPIAHKCLGLLQGNHERQYELHTEQQDRTTWLCCELGVPNLGYSALFDVVLVRAPRTKAPKLQWKAPVATGSSWTVRFFCHHGAGYAQTPGGKLNRLARFMDAFEADVYMCGHVHDQIARRQPILTANRACDELKARDRVGIVTGSYLKTYGPGTSYGEQRGYAPVNLGMASVTLRPARDAGLGQITAEV